MIDLSGVVLGMADTTLFVTRDVAAWGADGRPTSTSTTISVQAMVVPAKRRRSDESQGMVTYGAVDVYSAIELEPGDRFSNGGRNYRVESTGSYRPSGCFSVSTALVMP